MGQKKIVKLLMPAEGDNAGLDVKISMVLACESSQSLPGRVIRVSDNNSVDSTLGKAYNKFGMDFPVNRYLL